ncbi:Ferritin Dps family protein [Bacteroides coprosuis DSM 18011]|uniref:Ferritin Dps family protein n=1 Tax=Bacteroides coprosuis DSM 18011 TaxID=679937 RepID=F3ZSG4_9BACE|nr:DNA starvation/stationary phase protection protein [Bacteroides coprosuis]EGJ72116.1 Ferritin Dps family protein [Bacteroides coprosuis DSM 18011]
MKTLDYIKLNEAGSNKVIDSLQVLLADLQVYYTNLRNFHWNIKGRGFFQLHEAFEKMYDDVNEKVDEVAERILMLGGVPENKFSNYLKVARVKEEDVQSDGMKAIENILETIGHLIVEERKIIEIAGDNKDEATVSMMSDYLVEQEKSVWMLTSFMSK